MIVHPSRIIRSSFLMMFEAPSNQIVIGVNLISVKPIRQQPQQEVKIFLPLPLERTAFVTLQC